MSPLGVRHGCVYVPILSIHERVLGNLSSYWAILITSSHAEDSG